MKLPVIDKQNTHQCSCHDTTQSEIQSQSHQRRGLTRRTFLRTTTATVGGLAAFGAAISPLRELAGSDDLSMEGFFQKHYKEMSPEELDHALSRISDKVKKRFDITPNVVDVKPMDGVEFVYALNLSRCNGNRKCVSACMAENNQSRSPQMQYIRVLEMPNGTFDLEQSNHHYDEAEGFGGEHYYLPIQCHQCANPPCVKVCPVEATWQEADGITVIDYDWCIGCRYCEAACPYWARRFNFSEPDLPKEDLNPNMSYLSNRPRPKGVVEKCTFCLHRTRVGKMPACLEACPTGARKFGNILDPDSEVSQILKTKRVFVLKEDAGTLPRFFYYFDERHPRRGPDLSDASTSPQIGTVG